MSLSCRQISALVTNIQSDFLDNPRLTLTLAQARKRLATDETTCEAVLGAMIDARVLTRTSDGGYVSALPAPLG